MSMARLRWVTASLLSLVVLAMSAEGSDADTCMTFEEIYGSGKNLCEKMWAGAFAYVPTTDPDYDLAYTMWWFTDENPNDAVTARRVAAGLHPTYNDTDRCYLEYFWELDFPIATTGNAFSECHPWESKACCAKETVSSSDALREAYGSGYDWNRCGALSDECERFFVQEACMYECDSNAGLFRKYWDTYNNWQIDGMPIKGDYCDAFYRACKGDMFLSCANDPGNWFACKKSLTPSPTAAPTPTCEPRRVFVILDRSYSLRRPRSLDYGVQVLRHLIDRLQEEDQCVEVVVASLIADTFTWTVSPSDAARNHGKTLSALAHATEKGADWGSDFKLRSLALHAVLDEAALADFCGPTDSQCNLVILTDGRFGSRKERRTATVALRRAADELNLKTACVFPTRRDAAESALARLGGACDVKYDPSKSGALEAAHNLLTHVL